MLRVLLYALVIVAVYTLQQASEIVGLSVVTLRGYTSKRGSTLVRGQDFFVRRPSPYRRQVVLTEAGLKRLLARDYSAWSGARVYRSDGGRKEVDFARLKAISHHWSSVDYVALCASEARQRLKQTVELAARAYLEHPCAVPACPCSIHTLGVPQADVVREVMARKPGVHPNSGPAAAARAKALPPL